MAVSDGCRLLQSKKSDSLKILLLFFCRIKFFIYICWIKWKALDSFKIIDISTIANHPVLII
jgi:hypothetical protein